MDLLDSDAGLLKDRVGNQARRDIVQFVPFNQFANVGGWLWSLGGVVECWLSVVVWCDGCLGWFSVVVGCGG